MKNDLHLLSAMSTPLVWFYDMANDALSRHPKPFRYPWKVIGTCYDADIRNYGNQITQKLHSEIIGALIDLSYSSWMPQEVWNGKDGSSEWFYIPGTPSTLSTPDTPDTPDTPGTLVPANYYLKFLEIESIALRSRAITEDPIFQAIADGACWKVTSFTAPDTTVLNEVITDLKKIRVYGVCDLTSTDVSMHDGHDGHDGYGMHGTNMKYMMLRGFKNDCSLEHQNVPGNNQ